MTYNTIRSAISDLIALTQSVYASGGWNESYPIYSIQRLEQTLTNNKPLDGEDLQAALAILRRANEQTAMSAVQITLFNNIGDRMLRTLSPARRQMPDLFADLNAQRPLAPC